MRASLTIQHHQPDVIQHWLHVRQKLCHWGMLSDEIPGLSRESIALHAGPLSALALFDDVAQQRRINEVWIQRKIVTSIERLSPPSGYRHDRIRLGYMSSDFCQHAMSLLIAELFERHDRRNDRPEAAVSAAPVRTRPPSARPPRRCTASSRRSVITPLMPRPGTWLRLPMEKWASGTMREWTSRRQCG